MHLDILNKMGQRAIISPASRNWLLGLKWVRRFEELERLSMISDMALTWFINIWVGSVVGINVAAIIGFMSVAPTVWAGIGTIQEVYSPFNVWNWLLELLALSPALVAIWWRERRHTASNVTKTIPAELAPRGFFSGMSDATTPGGASKYHAQNESKRLQLAVVAAWVVLSGSMAIYRALEVDPADARAIALRLHPWASILGSLLPTVILAPFAYWLAGSGLRRYKARGPELGLALSRMVRAVLSAPQKSAPEPASALEAFLGGSPGAVVLKLLLISLAVGALMMWLEIRPDDIFMGVVDFVRRIYALGFGAVRELIGYVVAGAAIVVPVWLLLRALGAGGRK